MHPKDPGAFVPSVGSSAFAYVVASVLIIPSFSYRDRVVFGYYPCVKILVFGPRGYIGKQLLETLPGAVGSDADIADCAAVAQVLDAEKPDVIVNAAGKTGRPNIDWCEDHKPETVRGNVTGPLVLLEACMKRGIYYVHLSSGCIYDGDNGGKGFSEEDEPNFSGSFYSRTKIWSEAVLREFPVLILRLRMPFDLAANDRNLIMKLRKYPTVLDAENSITFLPDFLKATRTLIERRKTGIYNIVNPGSLSPYRIMELYREITDPSHTFTRLTLQDLSGITKAARSNCILSVRKLEQEGITMQPVGEAVRFAMESFR